MSNINDKKIRDYNKKKIEKWILIIALLLVIVLELLAIFNVISMLWGLVIFIIVYLFEKFILK